MVILVSALLASASLQLLMLAGRGSVLGRITTGRRGRLGTPLVSTLLMAALAFWMLHG